jgi:TP901 family phage tail tape measure protein
VATETSIRFKVETLDANRKVARLEKQVNRLEIAVRKAGGSTRAAGSGFKAFAGGAQAAAVGARGFGAALSAALGPLIAVGAAAASLGQAFGVLKQQDFAEAKVRSLGVNTEQLKGQLQDVSRELSGQASVLDLTSAAYDVASAGFNNAADAAKILKAASQGATGGFSDINTVGDATTSVLNAYGLEADKAAKLVDGFIQTQNDGKIVIGEYAANIAKVAPVAAALGVPLEEVNAAIAQITAGGQGAEVTFTALKTAFAQVAAGKVGKEFKAFGVEINASTLKSDGLAGTLEKIKKSGADAGTVIKAFGTEAGPSILALLNDTEKYNKLLENQKNAQGAAAQAAFTASDTIEGQVKRLTTAFQNLFSDQSELGILVKETFKVAAVTVEVFGVALTNTLAPVRAIFAAANQVGEAVSEALGLKGVNAAFALEKAFQATLGRAAQFGEFVIGLGVRIGQLVGGLASRIITAGKGVLEDVVGFFRNALERIVGFIGRAYNLIPAPIRKFLERGASAVTGFVQETIDLGRGVTADEGVDQQQQLQPPTQNNIVPTGGGVGATTASDTATTELERQQEAANKLKANLEDRITLASALTKDERAMLQLKIDQANIDEKFPLLSETARDKLKEKLEILYAEKNVTDAIVATREREAKAIADAAEKAKDEGEQLKELGKSIGSTLQAGIVDTITGAIDGSKSLRESLSGVLKQIGGILLNFGIGSIGSSLGIPGFGRANGGPVDSGRPYMVGERGPELFVPGQDGGIMRNEDMRRMMGNSPAGNAGMSMNFTFETTSIGGTEYVSREQLESAMATTRRQAASDGAKRGMNMTLDRMQNSPRTRARVGIS